MIKVDTFFNGLYIYEHDDQYFIVHEGIIISPAYCSLKDAQNNAWEYMEN